jgi:hypothetical protein
MLSLFALITLIVGTALGACPSYDEQFSTLLNSSIYVKCTRAASIQAKTLNFIDPNIFIDVLDKVINDRKKSIGNFKYLNTTSTTSELQIYRVILGNSNDRELAFIMNDCKTPAQYQFNFFKGGKSKKMVCDVDEGTILLQ